MRLTNSDSNQQPSSVQRFKDWLQNKSVLGWLFIGVLIISGLVVGFILFGGNYSNTIAPDGADTVTTEITPLAEPNPANPSEGRGNVSNISPKERITLDTAIANNPLSLDPALSVDVSSTFFIQQMFVGLTSFDENAKVMPSLATNWTVSDDGLQWTFYLRDDIYWIHRNLETGEFKKLGPVTAQDVVYGITRTLHPHTASDYAYVLYIIEGAEALNQAETNSQDIDNFAANLGVTALDDTTVVFRLNEPASYFSSIAGLWLAYPQPQAPIEAYGSKWTQPGLIVTNGPYTLQSWLPDQELWLEKNPFWIKATDVQIELFGGPIIASAAEAMALYEANKIDMMADPGQPPPLSDMDRIRVDAQLSQELLTGPRLCTYYYGFINKPPFDNPLVRKAFSAAINRQYLIENVTKGGQRPAHSFSPPGVFGNVADDSFVGAYLIEANYKDQMAQAQQWLAEAGYPQGEGLELVLGHNTSEGHAQIALAVQLMWQRAFPMVKIEVVHTDWPTYIDILESGFSDNIQFNIYRMGWCADYPDANNWLNDVFNSKSGSNYAHYVNPEFDMLVEQAGAEIDSNKRLDLYRWAEDILINQDAAIAPIFYYTHNSLYKPWLTKVVISPVTADSIAEWRLDWEAKKAAK